MLLIINSLVADKVFELKRCFFCFFFVFLWRGSMQVSLQLMGVRREDTDLGLDTITTVGLTIVGPPTGVDA